MTTWLEVWKICTLLLYALGVIGGPELKPMRHRSDAVAPSGPSRKARPRSSARVAATFCAACGVSGGILPSGGSTISEVRLSASVEPASYHPSSYADSSLLESEPSHLTKRQPPLGRFFRNTLASWSVRTVLPAY